MYLIPTFRDSCILGKNSYRWSYVSLGESTTFLEGVRHFGMPSKASRFQTPGAHIPHGLSILPVVPQTPSLDPECFAAVFADGDAPATRESGWQRHRRAACDLQPVDSDRKAFTYSRTFLSS